MHFCVFLCFVWGADLSISFFHGETVWGCVILSYIFSQLTVQTFLHLWFSSSHFFHLALFALACSDFPDGNLNHPHWFPLKPLFAPTNKQLDDNYVVSHVSLHPFPVLGFSTINSYLWFRRTFSLKDMYFIQLYVFILGLCVYVYMCPLNCCTLHPKALNQEQLDIVDSWNPVAFFG